LKVYDMSGREVTVLVQQQQMAAGNHRVNFSGRDLASGVYFYHLEATPLQGSTPAVVAKKAMSLVK
ncbi:T9SS type A sorting domain-containing protein, partial [candidate division KSB1 bacterium]|nr:T9SS type A sorting domain-containing protein [candidate division KSB1 bacterium]